MFQRSWFLPAALAAASAAGLAACGGDTTGPGASCSSPATLSLAPGQSTILDPAASGGCFALPAASGGAEYLVTTVATSTAITDPGVSGPFELLSGKGGSATASVGRTPAAAFGGLRRATGFDLTLRAYERELSRRPEVRLRQGPSFSIAAAPPVMGDKRTFHVLTTTTSPFKYTDVTATVRYAGQKVAIYLDDSVPAGGYSQPDLDAAGALFDQHMYEIDTTSFGRESDIDGNGVVVVLLTPAINRLSGACSTTGSVILGFFFGNDLLPPGTGSNGGEVFYGLVPDPNNASCRVPLEFAQDLLPPTFIHEFQHMISFNQHVLIRGGQTEDTWLNEGLSHFAEELGARQIPDTAGAAPNTRFSQFAFGNVDNAYGYLRSPDKFFVIEPGSSLGTLEERGANWLLVRWLADHFDTDSLGRNFTRKLVATNAIGGANVQAVTGEPMATLLTQWQQANYVDALKGQQGFSDPTGRLTYKSWTFARTFGKLHDQDPAHFPLAYPLVPDSVGEDFTRTGTLRGGSAHFIRVVQPAGAPATTVQLTANGTQAIGATLGARIGVVRIR